MIQTEPEQNTCNIRGEWECLEMKQTVPEHLTGISGSNETVGNYTETI